MIHRVTPHSHHIEEIEKKIPTITVADPGFPRRRGGTLDFGAKNLSFGKVFAKHCMKMKDIGPRGGVRVPSAPLDPPMIQ